MIRRPVAPGEAGRSAEGGEGRRNVWAALCRAVVPAAVTIILLATLYPEPESSAATSVCLLCARSSADFVLNVALFVPLGIALAFRHRSLAVAALMGFALSFAIELIQLSFMPGRHATPMDVLANGSGALTGWWLWARAIRLRPRSSDVTTAGWTSLAVGLGTSVLTVAALFLFRPAFPHADYSAQWTANRGQLAVYDGEVLQSSVGPMPLPAPPWHIQLSDSLQALLEQGAPIRVNFRVGSTPTSLAPIFSLYDADQREILLIGAQFNDLAFRYRSLSTAMKLDQGDLRLRGAFDDLRPGDFATATVEGGGRGFCLSVGQQRRCALGFVAGDTWMLLHSPRRLGHAARTGVTALWLLVLFLPTGLVAARWRQAAVSAVAVAGVLTWGPLLLGMVATPLWHLLVAAIGVLVGGGRWKEQLVNRVQSAPSVADPAHGLLRAPHR